MSQVQLIDARNGADGNGRCYLCGGRFWVIYGERLPGLFGFSISRFVRYGGGKRLNFAYRNFGEDEEKFKVK